MEAQIEKNMENEMEPATFKMVAYHGLGGFGFRVWHGQYRSLCRYRLYVCLHIHIYIYLECPLATTSYCLGI